MKKFDDRIVWETSHSDPDSPLIDVASDVSQSDQEETVEPRVIPPVDSVSQDPIADVDPVADEEHAVNDNVAVQDLTAVTAPEEEKSEDQVHLPYSQLDDQAGLQQELVRGNRCRHSVSGGSSA